MSTQRPMPAMFFGHGNPMNALEHNGWTDQWNAIGARIPRPRAVLSLSAHWYIQATLVTAMSRPRTIHDFGGFPEELYDVQYPALGSPDLAARVQDLLTSVAVGRDDRWGLDHGTWSVLCHVFPRADVPVVQLSIDGTKPPSFHYEIGKMLAPLRVEGVLVIGSGNVVHNLQAYAWGQRDVVAFDWAVNFEERVRKFLMSGEDGPLIDYESLGREAILSVPTPDHYLPLLYLCALRREGDDLTFPVDGLDGGSASMLTVQIG